MIFLVALRAFLHAVRTIFAMTKSPYDSLRAAEFVAHVASLAGGAVPAERAKNLLYLGEREKVRRHQYLLVFDELLQGEDGPYCRLAGREIDKLYRGGEWHGLLIARGASLELCPGYGAYLTRRLFEEDEAIAEDLWREHKDKSTAEMRSFMRSLPEFTASPLTMEFYDGGNRDAAPNTRPRPLDLRDLAKAVGVPKIEDFLADMASIKRERSVDPFF